MSDRYSAPSHFKPMPEFVSHEPGVYDIVDSRKVAGLPTNGMVDQENQVMVVPLEREGVVVSRHEVAHVAWTPKRVRSIGGSPAFIQAVEDGRINRGLQVIGLEIELDESALAHVVELGARDLDHGDAGLACWCLRTVASFGTNAVDPLMALIDEFLPPLLPLRGILEVKRPRKVRDLVRRAHARLERARVSADAPVADFAQVQRIARWLRGELADLGLPEPPHEPGRLCCLGVVGGKGKTDEGPAGVDGFPAHGSADGSGPGAGSMKIAEPPLPHSTPLPAKGVVRGRRASSEGVIMRDISRFAHDQRVFAARARRRRAGGSVLIDQSGSMSLSAADIDTLIAAAPAATLVAIYSGRETEGELRVVVRDGRRVGVGGLEPFGPANVVDLPALEWLAKQPEPRIWISDGRVTGEHDHSSQKVTVGCKRVCRRASIDRVGDAETAAKRLAGGRR